MKLMFIYFFIFLIIILAAKPAFAIVPPPILVNVGVSLLEILAIVFSIFIQGFLVVFGGKKDGKFRIKGIHLLLVIVLFFVVFFLYINTYKLLIRDRYDYLTKNLFRLPDEDYYINPQDRHVFTGGKDPGSIEDDLKPEFPGVSVEDVYDKLFSDDFVFIDIREPREYMACTIKGAVNVPADVLFTEIEKYGEKEIYLFGNGDVKAARIAEDLRKQGYNAYYIDRGIRWFASLGSGFFLYDNEGRDISVMPRFTEEQERNNWKMPPGKLSEMDYRNLDDTIFYMKNTHKLWGTKDVKKKLAEGKIKLVDVRPSAVAHEYIFPLSVSKMTIREIERKIEELPKDKGIIIACDDLYSAFEAEWLGCELVRRGYDYRGRYTNPGEFFLPPPQMIVPFHFTFERFAEYIFFGYQHLQFYIGHHFKLIPGRTPLLFYAFIAFIIILRLALLPLSFLSQLHKAKNNGILRERMMKGAIRPSGFMERVNYINNLQKEGLLLRILYIAPDLIIVTLAIITGFFVLDRGFYLAPWIADARQPSVVIALISALLLYVYELGNPFYFSMAKDQKKSSLFRLTPLIFAMVFFVFGAFMLPAVFMAFMGVNYLISIIEYQFASILCGKGRKKIVSGEKEAGERIPGRRLMELPGTGLYSIVGRDCKSLLLRSEIGGKAYNLAIMAVEGVPVPPGFIISADFFEKYHLSGGKLSPEASEELLKTWDFFDFDEAIVRSSAGREDSPQKSYAGIFESIPGITRESLSEGVERVYQSYRDQRASVYESGESTTIGGGVIVQEMIRADCRGVLFTVDPGDPVNMSLDIFRGEGGGETLESEAPVRVIIGRMSGKILNLSPEDERIRNVPVGEIVEIGRRLEDIFRNPQDIEWVFKTGTNETSNGTGDIPAADGSLYILQSRNIVYSDPIGDLSIINEKKRLLEKIAPYRVARDPCPLPEIGSSGLQTGVIWKFNEVSEVLPFPSPSSLSLFRKIWAPEGPIDRAYQSFGIPYNTDVKPEDILETVFGRLYINEMEEKRLLLRDNWTDRIAGLYGKLSIEYQKRTLHKFPVYFAEEFLREMNEKVETPETTGEIFTAGKECIESLLGGHLVQVFRVNIILDYCVKLIEKDLEGTGLTINDLSGSQFTGRLRGGEIIPSSMGSGNSDMGDILESYGHRAPEDYELSCPRFGEDPSFLENLAKRRKEKVETGGDSLQDRDSVENRLKNAGFSIAKIKKIRANFRNLVPYLLLKETGRDLTVKYIALLRKILLKIDDLFQLGGDIFNLDIDQIFGLEDKGITWEIKELIASGKKDRESFMHLDLPLHLSIEDIESIGVGENKSEITLESAGLKGIRVSGNRPVKGIARIAATLEDAKDIKGDEILIARLATTEWSIILPHIAGIVTEGGGMLSHLAILAREYGTPYIAGCRGAVSLIKNGDNITLMPGGEIKLSTPISPPPP